MERKYFKNLDKQVVGRRCYNVANDKWCVIMKVYSDYCVVRDEDDNVIYDEWREHLHPIAENLITSNKDVVCYEVHKGADYPYYCPADDKNYYSAELEDTSKGNAETSTKTNKYLKKSYKVKAVIVRKFVVEVDAKNWQEAKKKALEDLGKPIPSDNCNSMGVEPKIVNWK